MSAQEGCLQASPPASDGPAEEELLAHELEVLRAVAGVTSVLTYERQRREPLNKTMLKVRIEGRKNPLQVHCSEKVPNLLVAARLMIEKVGDVLGSDAVAEGRRLRAAEAAAGFGEEPVQPAAAQTDIFQKMMCVRQLEKELAAAEACAREADSQLRASLLVVAAEEKAARLAQGRVLQAQAAADALKEPLTKAVAAAATIREELAQMRSKRQRVARDELPSVDEPAQPEEVRDNTGDTEESSLHYGMYKEYSLQTFRALEAKQMHKRSILPECGVQARPLRSGEEGAMHHWRHGLVGAVQSWADGSLDHVVTLILKLVDHFQIADQISQKLKGVCTRLKQHAAVPYRDCCPGRC